MLLLNKEYYSCWIFSLSYIWILSQLLNKLYILCQILLMQNNNISESQSWMYSFRGVFNLLIVLFRHHTRHHIYSVMSELCLECSIYYDIFKVHTYFPHIWLDKVKIISCFLCLLEGTNLLQRQGRKCESNGIMWTLKHTNSFGKKVYQEMVWRTKQFTPFEYIRLQSYTSPWE